MREKYAQFDGLIADTPLCRLRKLVPRDDVTVYGKLEGTNLGGSVKDRAARSGRNPQTGQPIEIPAAKIPTFKPGKALKDAVND